MPSRLLLKKSLEALREVLRSCGVESTDIREVLLGNPELLRKRCQPLLMYKCREEDRAALKEYMTEEYKLSCIQKMDNEALADIFLGLPCIVLKPTPDNTGCEVERVEISPVTNSVFARDPQIITAKGLILSRMHSDIRNREVEIYELAWESLGVAPIGRIPADGFLEGGDFMTIRPDLALCGVGMRTNMRACEYMMEQDLLGTARFGAVLDRHDQSQQRMHLDTYFNMVNRDTALLLDFDSIPGAKGSDLRRFVQLFRQRDGKYALEREVEFGQLLAEEGIKVIRVSHEEQLQYMINFIIVSPTTIVTGNPHLGAKLKSHGVEMDVRVVPFEGVNRMYGSVHCATQITRY